MSSQFLGQGELKSSSDTNLRLLPPHFFSLLAFILFRAAIDAVSLLLGSLSACTYVLTLLLLPTSSRLQELTVEAIVKRT